jgi:hypothetical protein
MAMILIQAALCIGISDNAPRIIRRKEMMKPVGLNTSSVNFGARNKAKDRSKLMETLTEMRRRGVSEATTQRMLDAYDLFEAGQLSPFKYMKREIQLSLEANRELKAAKGK